MIHNIEDKYHIIITLLPNQIKHTYCIHVTQKFSKWVIELALIECRTSLISSRYIDGETLKSVHFDEYPRSSSLL